MKEKLFYELLQVSTGQLDCLSRGPSPEEWQWLYTTAQQQQVTGICYKGVEKLFEFGLRAPQDVSIDWMAEAEEIRMSNVIVNKRALTLQKRLTERKIYNTLLLGQGVALYYNSELLELRQPSGIDMFVDCGKEKAIKFVKQTGQMDVKHSRRVVWLDKWADTPVRLLTHVTYSKNPLKDYVIQRWFRQNRDHLFANESEFIMPSANIQVVYILQTLFEHFLKGQLNMRMLMDCFFILKKSADHSDDSKREINIDDVLSSFGISSFSHGVMWVMQEVFNADSKVLPMKPQNKEGELILQQLMSGRHIGKMMKHYPLQMIWRLI